MTYDLTPEEYAVLEAQTERCGFRNGFGQHCEKEHGHSGSHRCRMFSAEDADRAFAIQQARKEARDG